VLVGQVVYHLSHVPSPFCFIYFQVEFCTFCPGLALDQEPPTSTSQVAGIIGVIHHTQLILEKVLTFCPGVISNCDPSNLPPENFGGQA
jgi:hypothetical protein